jgi:hypothetical protein
MDQIPCLLHLYVSFATLAIERKSALQESYSAPEIHISIEVG